MQFLHPVSVPQHWLLSLISCNHVLGDMQSSSPSDGLRKVVPQGAHDHVEKTRADGQAYTIIPVNRNQGPFFILDFPLPMEYDARPYRCSTCHNQIVGCSEEVGEDMPLVGMADDEDVPILPGFKRNVEPSASYWTLSDDDIRREFPTVLVCRAPRQAPVWITPLVLLEICQAFYGSLNARSIRRHLCDLYSANILAWQSRMHFSGNAPYSFAWQLQALPGNEVLGGIILRGFTSFVKGRVRVMRRRQFCYNAQILRHDGCYWLAKVLRTGEFTCVLAFCGTDGSLLDVPVPLATES